jgi:two-component system, sensor histidine kinase RegB
MTQRSFLGGRKFSGQDVFSLLNQSVAALRQGLVVRQFVAPPGKRQDGRVVRGTCIALARKPANADRYATRGNKLDGIAATKHEAGNGQRAAFDAPAGQMALRHLFLLRCFSVLVLLVVMLVATRVYRVGLPLRELLFGATLLVGHAGYTAYLIRRREPVGEGEFFRQLVIDLQLTTYVLYFSAGHENPFSGVCYMPLVIAAACVRWPYAAAMAVITLGDFAFLDAIGALPLVMADGSAVPAEVIALAGDAGYLLTASQIAYFVTRVASASREQAAALAAAREQQLNDQLVLGFGTLAAGAAHELATPLTSISLLAGRAPLREGLATIAGQAEACRQTLRNLAEAANGRPGAKVHDVSLDDYLADIAARFRQLRPEARLHLDWAVPQPAPLVRDDATLAQALITLLNNAAEASRESVSMKGSLQGDTLFVEVADRGPGIPKALAARLGQPFVTTRGPGEGMGMGLFLAKTSVERLGGALGFSDRPGGGTCVSLTLPLATLQS